MENAVSDTGINGDLNLLAFENDMPVIHGLPWCGTSGISDIHTYPLGGILLLRQDKTDFIEDLSMDEKALLLMQRLISPIWNEQQLDCCLRFPKIYAQMLCCPTSLYKGGLCCPYHETCDR